MTDLLDMSERDWMRLVTDICRRKGIMYHHCRPAMQGSGSFSTPISGHAGFPDLVLIWPDGYLLFVELKAAKGRVSAKQQVWLDRLGDMAEVWRPQDQARVLEVLNRRVAA